QPALLFGVSNRLLGGGAGRLVGQAQSAEVEHLCPVDQGQVHLAGAQAGVGAGLAGKAELPVAGGVQRHKSQRCEHGRVGHDAAGLDAFFGQRGFQQVAKAVGAHLADQRGGAAVGLQRGQEIARRAARLGGQGGVPGGVGGNRGKVDEQFAQSNNIQFKTSLESSKNLMVLLCTTSSSRRPAEERLLGAAI